MQSNEYQNLAWQTAKPFYKVDGISETFEQLKLTTATLGLVSKAGELAQNIQKMFENGQAADRVLIDESLGDIQWYIAHVASLMKLRLDDVQGHNIAKLREKFGDVISQKITPKY